MNINTTEASHDDPQVDLVGDEDAGPEQPTARGRWSTRTLAMTAVAVAVAVLSCAAGLVAWSPWSDGVPFGAALVVDGKVVTITELDARMDALRALYGVVRPSDPRKLDAFRRDAAKSIAVRMILDKQVKERGIRVSDKQANDALDRFVTQQFGEGGHDAFVESLGNVGTSETQVREEIRRQLEYRLLIDDVVGEVHISDAELLAQFEARRSDLATPEQRVVRNIVLADGPTALKVRNRLAHGASIVAVAAHMSLDASTRDHGGELGAVARAQLEPAVGTAVFGASKGGLYGPVKGQFGWNVGRVDAIVAGKPATFSAVRDSLRERLVAEEGARRWWKWVAAQLRATQVRYAPAYQPDHPDAAPGTTSGLPSSPIQNPGDQ